MAMYSIISYNKESTKLRIDEAWEHPCDKNFRAASWRLQNHDSWKFLRSRIAMVLLSTNLSFLASKDYVREDHELLSVNSSSLQGSYYLSRSLLKGSPLLPCIKCLENVSFLKIVKVLHPNSTLKSGTHLPCHKVLWRNEVKWRTNECMPRKRTS